MKASSIYARDKIYELHILPYFADKRFGKIEVIDIDQWHGKILQKHLSPVRTRAIHMCFSALFNFVESRFGILGNPCRSAGVIGNKKNQRQYLTWTTEEFMQVIQGISGVPQRMAIILLFWTGTRKNEMYGLQWKDVDLSADSIDINKAYK